MSGKPVLLSGIKPTGDLHIGNYFGAIRQQVELTKEGKYKPFIFVADYHALNSMQNAQEMRRRTHELVMAYLAAGLDPKEVVLFRQSDVPAHTELCWIFDSITEMSYLMRAHAFKAAVVRSKEKGDLQFKQRPLAINARFEGGLLGKVVSTEREAAINEAFEIVTSLMRGEVVGTFNYPMLMAADILLYEAAVVPVGQDQKQHVEFARDTAEKFNRVFTTEVFKMPEAYIMPEVAVVPGTDGQKMSKSYGNVIPLFGSSDELKKRVMSIVTDSSGELPQNVYAIHKLVRSDAELKPLYEEHKGNYKELKELLYADLERYFGPMRARYEELARDPSIVDEVLEAGKQEARAASEAKMEKVRAAIGVR